MEKIHNQNEINLNNNQEEIKIDENRIRKSAENLFVAYNNGEQRIDLLVELLNPYLKSNLIEKQDEIKKDLLSCVNINDKNIFVNRIIEIVKPILLFIDKNPDIKKILDKEQSKDFKRKTFNVFNNYEQIGKYISYGIDDKTLHIHLPDADDLIKGKSRTILFDELKSDFNNLAKIVKDNDNINEIIASSWLVASKSNMLEHLGFVIDNESSTLDREERVSKYASISREDFLTKYFVEN
ncbi:MAG: hypothetical protein WCI91_00665 [Candidatus Nomurabacteria bacterium]